MTNAFFYLIFKDARLWVVAGLNSCVIKLIFSQINESKKESRTFQLIVLDLALSKLRYRPSFVMRPTVFCLYCCCLLFY